jgi:peroxiredoxin
MDRVNIRILVSNECRACVKVLQVIHQMRDKMPGLELEILNLEELSEIPENLNAVIVPATYVNGRLFAYGEFEPQELRAAIAKHRAKLSQTGIESNHTANAMETIMRRKPGEKAANIILPALDGGMFELDRLKGKRLMISFLRFASCPFCNLRVHELVKRFDEFGKGFTIVAIFDSSLENLRRHAEKHQAPFPILADEKNVFYREYGIEHSVAGMFKGMLGRMPALLRAMLVKGYVPWVIKGSLTTMPADFLVDENGVIRTVYYGKDEGDHLPFERVKAFSLASKIMNVKYAPLSWHEQQP